MGKFQIFVLLSVVTCAIISTVQSVPVQDSSVTSENAAKCKKLCGFCGCDGYFCGDECLCECNSSTEGTAECVDTMKSNCKKLELPFEVLIQGPNVNRMVRSLLYADPEEETCAKSSESNQKKRSTISIYKPHALDQQVEILPAPAAEEKETLEDDSPVHVIVVPKSNIKVVAAKEEEMQQIAQPNENVENIPVVDVESKDNSDSVTLPLPEDAVDRTNIKRHIIDVNQEISELTRDSEDDSFIYKRDAEPVEVEVEEEKEEVIEIKGDEVGSPAPAAPAPAPAAPVAPAPLLPKFRGAINSIKAQIPTSTEIKETWEGVRNELNTKINSAIDDAKKRAAALRAKIVNPAPAPAPAAPARFNPFFKAEDNVGMAVPVVPAVPLVPVVPAFAPIQTEVAKNMAANRAASVQFQSELAKNLATLRINNKLAQGTARAEVQQLFNNFNNQRWFQQPLVRDISN